MTRIKICCIASVREAHLAIDAGADALGLVGDMPTGPGVIDEATAADIAEVAPPTVASFLLTSHSTAPAIAEHALRVGANTIQVVRHVEPGVHDELDSLLPRAVRRVQVVHVEDESALDIFETYADRVHAFLLDSGSPTTDEFGGTGRTHDWEISREFVTRSSVPVFLAGGLTPENVARAVGIVRPFGVDVCSGLRPNGALDPGRLSAFVEAVRSV
jgi:phosphoribosylanthranilate isomerase